ncbi:retention in endoplasmic reticulum protein 1 [Mucor atramentarius]
METIGESAENSFMERKSSIVAIDQLLIQPTDGYLLALYLAYSSCVSFLRKDGISFGIYLLNMFLAFLTPKFDPSLEEEEEDEEGPTLPTRNDEEFRPFIRRLPEFKFWYVSTKATAIALVCSFVPAFDIPVFWPILLVYFCLLFALTMRRQIQHMIRYRYVPFDIGKRKYKKVVNMDAVGGGESSSPSN